ncbi:coatomer subunit delta-like [Oppia nitens]|uniref:coatomer subunit delta-like n=1 Tax=Oppia nitens TaxID=1686743 RepID=UPI0023DCBACE|nr:coatomer subunit delta-like [Oppia nitens]
MVLLAAGVVSKVNGKILLSRQFVEMTRSRIEGLLTAFTKLITKDKQHTFIETDTVRYVYQALMDKLYCVLITTKTSNILEDLETLRLFVRVISEYTSNQTKGTSDEQSIADNAFTLIFAFDEIVALGYRESVNMSQVRTFIEMDSHEERVFVAVRQTQEREAKQKMREKAKELSRLQKTQQIERLRGLSGGSMNSSINSSLSEAKHEPTIAERPAPAVSQNIRSKGPSKALKLGSRSGNSMFSVNTEEQLAHELTQEDGL